MENPIESLGPPKVQIEAEDVEGTFSCMTARCYRVATEAKYIRANRLLTWKCPDGHISRTEIDL